MAFPARESQWDMAIVRVLPLDAPWPQGYGSPLFLKRFGGCSDAGEGKRQDDVEEPLFRLYPRPPARPLPVDSGRRREDIPTAPAKVKSGYAMGPSDPWRFFLGNFF